MQFLQVLGVYGQECCQNCFLSLELYQIYEAHMVEAPQDPGLSLSQYPGPGSGLIRQSGAVKTLCLSLLPLALLQLKAA